MNHGSSHIPFALCWKSGDRVLAKWDAYFYPGRVLAVERTRCHIRFDDGDQDWIDSRVVLPLDIQVGSRVFGNWKGGGIYFPGCVDQRDGDRLHILYDDGDREWTTLSKIRVERAGAAGLPAHAGNASGVEDLRRLLESMQLRPAAPRPIAPAAAFAAPAPQGSVVPGLVLIGLVIGGVLLWNYPRVVLLVLLLGGGLTLAGVLASRKKWWTAAACLVAGVALAWLPYWYVPKAAGLSLHTAGNKAQALAKDFDAIAPGDWKGLEKHQRVCADFLKDFADHKETLAEAAKAWAQRSLAELKRRHPATPEDYALLKEQWAPLSVHFPALTDAVAETFAALGERACANQYERIAVGDWQRLWKHQRACAEFAQNYPSSKEALTKAAKAWAQRNLEALQRENPSNPRDYALLKDQWAPLETAFPDLKGAVADTFLVWAERDVNKVESALQNLGPLDTQGFDDTAEWRRLLSATFPKFNARLAAAERQWFDKCASRLTTALNDLAPEQWQQYQKLKVVCLFLDREGSPDHKTKTQLARQAWGERAVTAVIETLAKLTPGDFGLFHTAKQQRDFLAREFPALAPSLAKAELGFGERSGKALQEDLTRLPAGDCAGFQAGTAKRQECKSLFAAQAAGLEEAEAKWGLRTVEEGAKVADKVLKTEPLKAAQHLHQLAAQLQECGAPAAALETLLARRKETVKACLEFAKRQTRALIEQDRFQAAEKNAQAFLEQIRGEAKEVALLDDVERFQQAVAVLAAVARKAGQPDPRQK